MAESGPTYSGPERVGPKPTWAQPTSARLFSPNCFFFFFFFVLHFPVSHVCVLLGWPSSGHVKWQRKNDNYNMSYETKCETNYSIITKWNDVNTHNYMQLTKHNKYTNDDVNTDACRGAHHALSSHTARTLAHLVMSSHTSLAQVLSHFTTISMSSWRTLFDSLLPFYFYLFLTVYSFYFLHSELYSELDNPIVM